MQPSNFELVLTALGYKSDAEKKNLLAHLSDDQWCEIVALASRQGVGLLLAHRLKHLDITLPGGLAEQLQSPRLRNTARNLRMYQVLGKFLSRMNALGIPVIVLKGAYLASQVYENVALRGMIDLDVLVRKQDLMRVEQELLASHFVPHDRARIVEVSNHHFRYSAAHDGPAIEVHWKLVRSTFAFQIDVEGLWARAQRVIIANTPALALSPEDLLLHLCIHAALHASTMRLRILCDIGEVVRRFEATLDWRMLSERALEWQSVRAVHLILRLAHELLDARVPEEILGALKPNDFDERYFVLACEQIVEHGVETLYSPESAFVKLWGRRTFSAKLKLLRDNVFVSRTMMARAYPVSPDSWRVWLYYPVRVKDILARNKSVWMRLITLDPEARRAAEITNERANLRDWLLSA